MTRYYRSSIHALVVTIHSPSIAPPYIHFNRWCHFLTQLRPIAGFPACACPSCVLSVICHIQLSIINNYLYGEALSSCPWSITTSRTSLGQEPYKPEWLLVTRGHEQYRTLQMYSQLVLLWGQHHPLQSIDIFLVMDWHFNRNNY